MKLIERPFTRIVVNFNDYYSWLIIGYLRGIKQVVMITYSREIGEKISTEALCYISNLDGPEADFNTFIRHNDWMRNMLLQ